MRHRSNAVWPSLLSILLVLSCSDRNGGKNWEKPALIQLPKQGPGFDWVKFRQQLQDYTPPANIDHKHDRQSSKCRSCTVEVHIRPIGLDTDVGPDIAPNQDRLVASIVNKDPTYLETIYNFQPDAKAEYFIWLQKNPSTGPSIGNTIWKLVEITKDGNTGTVTYIASGIEKECGPGTGVSDADFKSCEQVHPPASSTKTSALISFDWLTRLLPPRSSPQDTSKVPSGDPAWLRCTQGCCTLAAM